MARCHEGARHHRLGLQLRRIQGQSREVCGVGQFTEENHFARAVCDPVAGHPFGFWFQREGERHFLAAVLAELNRDGLGKKFLQRFRVCEHETHRVGVGLAARFQAQLRVEGVVFKVAEREPLGHRSGVVKDHPHGFSILDLVVGHRIRMHLARSAAAVAATIKIKIFSVDWAADVDVGKLRGNFRIPVAGHDLVCEQPGLGKLGDVRDAHLRPSYPVINAVAGISDELDIFQKFARWQVRHEEQLDRVG